MATYTAQKVGSTLLQPTYRSAASGGDKVSPGVLLHIKNASASSINATVVTAALFDTDLAVADRVNAVAAGAEGFVRVPNNSIYTNSAGLVDLTWSAVTSVTFAIVE